MRLLCKHPAVTVTYLTSESQVGVPISNLYPGLRGHIDLACESFDPETACAKADVFFYALPAGEAMKSAATLLAAGKKVVDLGADFRLQDPERYRAWYRAEPAPADLLARAVYGLPELNWRRCARPPHRQSGVLPDRGDPVRAAVCQPPRGSRHHHHRCQVGFGPAGAR